MRTVFSYLTTAALAGAAFVPAASLAAQTQSPEQYQAYLAMTQTPIGALSPVMTSTVSGELQEELQIALRYGYLSDLSTSGSPVNVSGGGGGAQRQHVGANDFAVTLILPGTLGNAIWITGAEYVPTCGGCSAHPTVSLGSDVRLASTGFGNSPTPPVFIMSLSGEIGYATHAGATYTSGVLGLPLSLAQHVNGVRIVPFLTPQFGFGSTRYLGSNASGSATRFGAAGGVGVSSDASQFAVNLGFQWVDVPNAVPVYGVSVRFGR